MEKQNLKLDVKEIEFPETVFSRDIETRVIQVIILHCLAKIDGVSLVGGNLIDTLFGRDIERMKGIYVEQDTKNHLVKVKVEVNIEYGVSIPSKTEEIQNCIVSEISEYTGLHVASVHVIIKGLVQPHKEEQILLENMEHSEVENVSMVDENIVATPEELLKEGQEDMI